MKGQKVGTILVAVAISLCTWSCALLSKSAPIAPRYFSPERPGDLPGPNSMPAAPVAELRLGRVDGASHLDERLVFRSTPSEIGYYRLRRWTEAPQQYLRRRLARVLFEERGVRQVVGGRGQTLEVQLTAFEEMRVPRRTARVQIIARLHDERVVRWQGTVTVDLPIGPGRSAETGDETVEALGQALRSAVDQVADRVVREMAVASESAPDAPLVPSAGLSR